ncbi:unnamed protein product, partial [Didymodactylos carnosus]
MFFYYVSDDKLFLTLYKEMYFRHIYASKPGGVTLEERIDSYVNYIDLFNMVLAKEPLKLDLPDQWLWDIIEEFIYQFQSFCNFRTKLQKRTDDDVDQLKRNSKMWSIHAVLNVLHSLVDKSKIVEQLGAIKKGVPFDDGGDQICQTNLYKMLGYFSLIGLLKLHTLTSDYYMALKTIECIDLDVTKQHVYCQVPHCIVATNYHAGYCFTMMRRYEDAIRIFVDTYLYVLRIKTVFTTQTFQNDAVNKTAEQMLLLLSICLTLCPMRIDEVVYQQLREKFQDKLNKPLLTTGADGKMQFRDYFGFACPKFISPSPTIYDQRTDQQWAEPFNKQIEVFTEELQEQINIPDVRSYLKLYTTLNIDKLAGFMEKTPQEVKTILLTFKHKLSRNDWAQKKEEDFQSSADIDFYVDKEIIHIADTKVTRRYSDYLVKQILNMLEESETQTFITRKLTFKNDEHDDNDENVSITILERCETSYGLYLWPASPVLAQYLWHYRSTFIGKCILEIGSGTSLPGILCCKIGAEKVILSDIENCLKLINEVVKVNNVADRIYIEKLNWYDKISVEKLLEKHHPDIIIASDIFFNKKDFESIIAVLNLLFEYGKPSLICITTVEIRSRSTMLKLNYFLRLWNLNVEVVPLNDFNGDVEDIACSKLFSQKVTSILRQRNESLNDPVKEADTGGVISIRQQQKQQNYFDNQQVYFQLAGDKYYDEQRSPLSSSDANVSDTCNNFLTSYASYDFYDRPTYFSLDHSIIKTEDETLYPIQQQQVELDYTCLSSTVTPHAPSTVPCSPPPESLETPIYTELAQHKLSSHEKYIPCINYSQEIFYQQLSTVEVSDSKVEQPVKKLTKKMTTSTILTPPTSKKSVYARLDCPQFGTYDICQEKTVIGRQNNRRQIDINMGASSVVSRVHFELYLIGNEFQLKCIGKNGIFINTNYTKMGATTVLPKQCSLRFPSTTISITFSSFLNNRQDISRHASTDVQRLPHSSTSTTSILQQTPPLLAPSLTQTFHQTVSTVPQSQQSINHQHNGHNSIKNNHISGNIIPLTINVPSVKEMNGLKLPGIEVFHSSPPPMSPVNQISSITSCSVSPISNTYNDHNDNFNLGRMFSSDTRTSDTPTIHRKSSNDYSADLDKNSSAKPPFSYAQLIVQAIASAEDRQMTLSQIYTYISMKYPYYESNNRGWQNSIRHNLSLNRYFIRVARKQDDSGKGSFWRLDPTCEDKLIEQAFRHRKQRGLSGGRSFGDSTCSDPQSPTPFDQSDYPLSDTNNNLTTSRPTTPFSPFDGISPSRDKTNSRKYSFTTNQEQILTPGCNDESEPRKSDNNNRTIPFPVLLCSANGNNVLGVVEPSLLRKCFLLGMSVPSSTALTTNVTSLPSTTITTNIMNDKKDDNSSLSTTILSKYPNGNENNTNYDGRHVQQPYNPTPLTKSLLSMKTVTAVQSDSEYKLNILSGVNNTSSVPAVNKTVRRRKPKKRTANGQKSSNIITNTQQNNDEIIIQKQDHEQNAQQNLVVSGEHDDQQRIPLYQLLCDILQQPEISRLLRDYSESMTNDGDSSSTTATLAIPQQLMTIVSLANALYNNNTSQLTSALKIDDDRNETVEEAKEIKHETDVPSSSIHLPDDQIQEDIQDLRMSSNDEPMTTQVQENDVQLSEYETLLTSLNELAQNIDDESLTHLLSAIDPNILATIRATTCQEQAAIPSTTIKSDEQQQHNQQDELQQIISELFRKQKLYNLPAAAAYSKNDEQTTNVNHETEQNQQQYNPDTIMNDTNVQLISNYSLMLSSATPLQKNKEISTLCFDPKIDAFQAVKSENKDKRSFNDKQKLKRSVSSQSQKRLKRKIFSSSPSSPVLFEQITAATNETESLLKKSKSTANDDEQNHIDDSLDKEVENYTFGNNYKRKTSMDNGKTEEDNMVKKFRKNSTDENKQQQSIPLLLSTIVQGEAPKPDM